MSDVASVKERVQTHLTSGGPVQIDAQGTYSLAYGSTRVFVLVKEHPDGKATLVDLYAIVAWEVPASPELFEWVAREGGSYFFGHLHLWDDPDVPGTVSVSFRHTLLGDYLDKDELMYSVYGVGGTADELDDEVVRRFGGRVFAPPPA